VTLPFIIRSMVNVMVNAMKYWPVAVAIFAIISGALTAQFQIQMNKLEIVDLSESIDENEEWLEELQWQIDDLR